MRIGATTMLVGLVTTLLAPSMTSAASNANDNDSSNFPAASWRGFQMAAFVRQTLAIYGKKLLL